MPLKAFLMPLKALALYRNLRWLPLFWRGHSASGWRCAIMAAIEEDDALVVRGSKRLHDLLEHRQCRPGYRPMDTAVTCPRNMYQTLSGTPHKLHPLIDGASADTQNVRDLLGAVVLLDLHSAAPTLRDSSHTARSCASN